MKLEALLLYISSMSMNTIAKHLNVSAQSILNWVRDSGEANHERPVPGKVIVIELDEIWHFIGSKSGENQCRRKT